jgi:hypothetical protein
VSNLHGIWDSVIYKYTGYPVMPLSTTDWNWYTTTTDEIATQFPSTNDEILPEDFMGWA